MGCLGLLSRSSAVSCPAALPRWRYALCWGGALFAFQSLLLVYYRAFGRTAALIAFGSRGVWNDLCITVLGRCFPLRAI